MMFRPRLSLPACTSKPDDAELSNLSDASRKQLTSMSPAEVKTSINNAIYWSVSFGVSCCLGGASEDFAESDMFRDLRYTEVGHVSENDRSI